ncbi:MAG: flagellar biosynthetic protein FliR [bacterium]|nr:flagellar biosynthetic protein FliR [candidate division KSB1 bacterium]MDH7559330.1 flagellar biosynthetic protein FliR [bacterium]
MVELKLNELLLAFVALARIATVVAIYPLFGHQSVPTATKVGLSLLLTALLFPSLRGAHAALPVQVVPLLLVLAKEVLIGMAIGFVAAMLFAGVELGGTLVGMQMGLAIVTTIDPQTREQASLIGQAQQLVALLLFLVIDGHHFLLRALFHSFDALPILGGSLSGGVVEKVVRMAGGIFSAGVRIGAPGIVALLLTTVALGVLARTVPQMNVFFAALPANIAIGLLVLALSIPVFAVAFRKLFAEFQLDLLALLRLM